MERFLDKFLTVRVVEEEDPNLTEKLEFIIAADTWMMISSEIAIQPTPWMRLKETLGLTPDFLHHYYKNYHFLY